MRPSLLLVRGDGLGPDALTGPRRSGWKLLLVALLALAFAAPAGAIERRKDQFPTEFSYLVVPLPYSLPGIGEGFFVPFYFSNIADTTTDAYGLAILGDAKGKDFGVEELPLIRNHLLLEVFYEFIDVATVNQYPTRGMDSSADDYFLVEVDKADSFEQGLALTLFERRFTLGYLQGGQAIEVVRLRDKDGNVTKELSPPYTAESRWRTVYVLGDYTDDFQDPRRGVRLLASWTDSPNVASDAADFYKRNVSLTGYLPVGRLNTLALNYFRSDAYVRRPGETNLTVLKAQLGLNCGADPVCLAREDELARAQLAANVNGTSESLGGRDRLRAYPQGRFQGAHTYYAAAEFRWNLTEEVTPFDYFIWKDVRTGVQLAFFYETGSVSETAATLGDLTRSDYGIGARLIAGSGAVYRGDVAWGDEGSQVTIIVNYPF